MIDTELNNERQILNLEDTASLLGVSPAALRNWVKLGFIVPRGGPLNYYFYIKDIKPIQLRLLKAGKLNQRANKSRSKKNFTPKEYTDSACDEGELNSIINFIKEKSISKSLALFLVSLNFLQKQGILNFINLRDLIKEKKLNFTNKQIAKEIYSWFSEVKGEGLDKSFSFLLACDLPNQRDSLGLIYQSLLFEGEKSNRGSYYTPSKVVNDIVKEYLAPSFKALDPCCGTGQFLLAFADKIKDPKNIYGIDSDKTAVRIARLNLLTRFQSKKFTPNIFCKNTLFDMDQYNLFNYNNKDITSMFSGFHLIATNPPWGAYFSKKEKAILQSLYPQISSFESFSYFLLKSLDWLEKRGSGVISFILPEAVLNVKSHKDIRGIILRQSKVIKIIHLERIFKSVFTPVIRIDLKRSNTKINQTTIARPCGKTYKAKQNKWLKNADFTFNIHAEPLDVKIIDKIYGIQHTNLKNKAQWALGIVTGKNKEFIRNKKAPGFEPIYRGKDVNKFILSNPSCYIQFQEGRFQQTASMDKYRVKEKLIYRFISKQLVFAYDNKKRLTLNSANILIPSACRHPIKVILALFNSSVYQFLFQKQFSSIKVLRSHIEELPLPFWRSQVHSKIITMTNRAINKKNNFHLIDNYIIEQFNLSKREIARIKNSSRL